MQRILGAIAFVGLVSIFVLHTVRRNNSNRVNNLQAKSNRRKRTTATAVSSNVDSKDKGDRVESLPSYVAALARMWCQRDPDEETRKEVQSWITNKQLTYAKERLEGKLHFGTAGLRGTMAAGYDRINVLTVLQATQGVLKYLEKLYGANQVRKRGICVGRDSRHQSHKLAVITQAVFLQSGVPVNCLSLKPVPTPLVSFAVTQLQCVAGIMITASHNPKNDNGYKLYLEDGCQILPPHDKYIEELIQENAEPWFENYADWLKGDKLQNHPLFTDKVEEIIEAYNNIISSVCHVRQSSDNKFAPAITYSPLHGVGALFFKRLCKSFGFPDFIMTKSQEEPNPDFPTAPFPNPEEGPQVFKEAFKEASNHATKLILMNDPDADRFAAAEYNGNEWRIFTGNEIAFLLVSWLWENRFELRKRWKQRNNILELEETEFAHPNNFACVASAVSSKFIQTMAEKEGFQFRETLTGFKWLSHAALELEQQQCQLLLAYEEALGYMCTTQVRDKDGLSTAAIFWELACATYQNEMLLADRLNLLYEKYGYFLSCNGYLLAKSSLIVPRLFQDIRNSGYPSDIMGCKVVSYRDLATGVDTAEENSQTILPWSPSTCFITVRLQTGRHPSFPDVDVFLSIRGSGTEPKLKYYSEMRCDNATELQSDNIFLVNLVTNFIQNVLKPEENDLAFPKVGE
ncbi:Glucose 1,6-bisphosphate synthase [Galdieria sulphuraria]|uniref:Phosphoglucomutase n=1 Tax=Galdieria sulphuraria TaxID=130081 RepID=M2Y232_GALSU|nr:phosphoglucomutase [Galdieria sulphuraria]EME29859.1 phosphoglucomutase [Galdieria sulphuraria]GJD06847.1 Glucose 1,6-bisphosphate synthase [Galdieria sulphuraria]|eukprot:XP_005706379.1 phosphoglucomutase [Galdieria sulphuraria]